MERRRLEAELGQEHFCPPAERFHRGNFPPGGGKHHHCRISGSGKTLEVRTLGCAEDFPLPTHALNLAAISKPSSTNSQHKRHEIYTSLGHRCGVIPYSSVVWWIASRTEDEQYKGKNSLLRRGVLVLGGCEDELNEFDVSCLLLWWLVLFIEALVLFPNIEREGSQPRPI